LPYLTRELTVMSYRGTSSKLLGFIHRIWLWLTYVMFWYHIEAFVHIWPWAYYLRFLAFKCSIYSVTAS